MSNANRGQRIGLTVLIVMAALLMTLVAYVLVTDQDRLQRAYDELEREQDALEVDYKNPPSLYFPEQVRSYDFSLNQFIDRFIRSTQDARYSEFRTMWTRDLDPISENNYARLWRRVKSVTVLSLTPIDEVKRVGIEAYRVSASVELTTPGQTEPEKREIKLPIVNENGIWVFSTAELLEAKAMEYRIQMPPASKASNESPATAPSLP